MSWKQEAEVDKDEGGERGEEEEGGVVVTLVEIWRPSPGRWGRWRTIGFKTIARVGFPHEKHLDILRSCMLAPTVYNGLSLHLKVCDWNPFLVG